MHFPFTPPQLLRMTPHFPLSIIDKTYAVSPICHRVGCIHLWAAAVVVENELMPCMEKWDGGHTVLHVCCWINLSPVVFHMGRRWLEQFQQQKGKVENKDAKQRKGKKAVDSTPYICFHASVVLLAFIFKDCSLPWALTHIGQDYSCLL